MNKKHFLLLLTLICLGTGNVWGTPEDVSITISAGDYALSNNNTTCQLGGPRAHFYIEKSSGSLSINSEGCLKFSDNTTAYLKWTGEVGYDDLCVKSVTITVKKDSPSAGRTFKIGTSSEISSNPNAYKEIAPAWNDGKIQSPVTISNLNYNVSRGSTGIYMNNNNVGYYIVSLTITYSVSPRTYYFQAQAIGNTGGSTFASFDGDYSEVVAITSATGSIIGDSAVVPAYFKAIPADGYNFEGWYYVDENGEMTGTRISDQLICEVNDTSFSVSSANPNELVLYANFTQLRVPQFTFSLKAGILGDNGASTTYENVFTTDNQDTDITSVSSSNTNVATVSLSDTERTFDVTVLSKGTTEITVVQAGLSGEWIEKSAKYVLTVVNKGEWIWQQDEVVSTNDYYLYAAGNGFLNVSNGFDSAPSYQWTVGGTWRSAYTLSEKNGSHKFSIYRSGLTSYAKTSETNKSDEDVVLSSAFDGNYYTIYRFTSQTNRNVVVSNGAISAGGTASSVWVFISPNQIAASNAYATASSLLGTTRTPSLDNELSNVLGENNYTSTDWAICKANLDAIIAKCEAFDADYAKFNEDGNKRTINTTADGFATIYYACPIELPDGVTAYKGAYSDGVLTLTDIDRDGYVPASTPVLLHNDDGSNTSIVLTYYNGNVSSVTGNKLHGTSDAITLSGTTVDIDDVSGTPYGLGQKNSHAGFYRYANNGTISANKAFLVIDDDDDESLAAIRIIREETITTDAEMFDSANTAEVTKFFENGQLFIKRDGVIYDAIGRKIR